MTHEANGTFEISLVPTTGPEAAVGRLTLAKTFHGDLEATSAGEMLSFRSATGRSAGYVAMERVTGTLAGRAGSFALQHSGTMDRGVPTLRVSVVPDSGTDALTGLAGRMTIEVVGGEHRYGFRYGFAE